MKRAEPEVVYLTWPHSDGGYSIQYALPVFQQIDALVNDGYRRIPHGGIETGGLLFGAVTGSTIRIDSFRQIECEHAFGPSFHLSGRDLEQLNKQLAAAADDTSLHPSVPVGWFVAHTRSELVLNEREIEFFDRLFPGAGRVSVLAKPEKFKPTRFAILVRDRQGRVQTDGRELSSLLPPPERVSESKPVPPAEIPRTPPRMAELPRARPPEPPQDDTGRTEENTEEQKIAPPPVVEIKASGKTAAAKTTASALPEPVLSGPPAQEASAETTPAPSAFLSRSLFVAALVFAALAAYGFYLRFTPAVVPVTLTPAGDKLIVSWPAAETQDAGSAELRIDNGPAHQLSDSEKASGTYSVNTGGGDVLVDLVIHHRFRTSRGVTRFLAAPPGL